MNAACGKVVAVRTGSGGDGPEQAHHVRQSRGYQKVPFGMGDELWNHVRQSMGYQKYSLGGGRRTDCVVVRNNDGTARVCQDIQRLHALLKNDRSGLGDLPGTPRRHEGGRMVHVRRPSLKVHPARDSGGGKAYDGV